MQADRNPTALFSALCLAAMLAGIGCRQAEETPSDPPIAVVVEDGAWCWFADPRALYHEGDARKTYFGWISSADSTVSVAAYDHAAGTLETAPLKTLHQNDHANPALLMQPDGRLMVFYSAHNGDTMYYRETARPEDLSAWMPERSLGTNTAGELGYTYPNPIRLEDEGGRLYLFWRGGNWQPNFSTSDDGRAWSDARTLLEVPGERPYVKVVSDGHDQIHFAFTEGHPGRVARNGIYYLTYRGGTFYRADGTRVGTMDDLPLRLADAEVVYDAAADSARAWIWDVALDEAERPVIVYATFPDTSRHRYHYARWQGEKWERHLITEAGGTMAGPREPHYSGGVVLDHEDPGTVYLSRPAEGLHRLERWRTQDGGATWTADVLAADTTAEHIRPVSVRGHQDELAVLWMKGRYQHYTDYQTQLLGYPLEPEIRQRQEERP